MYIRVITKLPNSEQSSKGKVKTRMLLTHFWKFYMNWFKDKMYIATTTLCRLLNVLPNVNLQNYFWAFELSGSKLPYGSLNLRNIVPVFFSLPKCLFGTAYSEDFIICKYIYHAHATYLTVICEICICIGNIASYCLVISTSSEHGHQSSYYITKVFLVQ